MMAEEPRPKVRAAYQDLLRTLKRVYDADCVMEWCSVGIANQEN
jgi:hypothetical protein